MLLPSQKPCSSYSLLKFVLYVTAQLRHLLVVYCLLTEKILDSPLRLCRECEK